MVCMVALDRLNPGDPLQDMQLNNRESCSVCHSPYIFKDVDVLYSFAHRLQLAVRSRPLLLITQFTFYVVVAFLSFYFFAALSFEGRLSLNWGSDALLLLGASCLIATVRLMRAAVSMQPSGERRRALISPPQGETGTSPASTSVVLLTVVVPPQGFHEYTTTRVIEGSPRIVTRVTRGEE